MSFIHYLFLGHFERQGERIRLFKNLDDPVYKPRVKRPIDIGVIKAVLQEQQQQKSDELVFPDDWAIWKEDGYLVCDKYIRNPEAITFVARLVERTHCDVYDVSAHCAITLGEWLAATNGYTRS
jgi:hypothetical protein